MRAGTSPLEGGASQGKEGRFCPWGEPEGVQKTHRVLSHPKSAGKHLCPVAQPCQGVQSSPTKVTLLGAAKTNLELSSKERNFSLLQEITWPGSCDAADRLNARNSSNSRISPGNGSASKPQRCFGAQIQALLLPCVKYSSLFLSQGWREQ